MDGDQTTHHAASDRDSHCLGVGLSMQRLYIYLTKTMYFYRIHKTFMIVDMRLC